MGAVKTDGYKYSNVRRSSVKRKSIFLMAAMMLCVGVAVFVGTHSLPEKEVVAGVSFDGHAGLVDLAIADSAVPETLSSWATESVNIVIAESIESEAPSSWAAAQVYAAIEAGVAPEVLQSKYGKPVTRAEFCALAVAFYEKVTGKEINGRASFADTSDINVEKMAFLGLVNGINGSRFAPDDKLSREQAATMLSRLAEAVGKPLPKQPPSFADNTDISSWALDAVGQMQAAGIMGGVGDNVFSPVTDYTREQSIITIMRLFLELNKQDQKNQNVLQNTQSFLSSPSVFEEVFRAELIDASTREIITGVSWKEGCPVPIADLRLITVTYIDFALQPHLGQLIMHKNLAEEILAIFKEIYNARFPIERMELVDIYGADDKSSMESNNTSAFNYRVVEGSANLSKHAFGCALDINPIQNPYVLRGRDYVSPDAGRAYIDRNNVRPGMITEDDVVHRAFKSRGWTWGGDWINTIDYQHFQKEIE